MELTPGTRLESPVCDGQVVVVKAPAGDVDLRCGGHPMRPLDSGEERLTPTVEGEPLQMGKRYADDEVGLEVLCSKAGEGTLTVGDTPLPLKGAKPLPSSD